MIKIILIFLAVVVIMFILFTFVKSIRAAFVKIDFDLEKKDNQKKSSRVKYSLSVHQEEIKKMDQKIEDFKNAINRNL